MTCHRSGSGSIAATSSTDKMSLLQHLLLHSNSLRSSFACSSHTPCQQLSDHRTAAPFTNIYSTLLSSVALRRHLAQSCSDSSSPSIPQAPLAHTVPMKKSPHDLTSVLAYNRLPNFSCPKNVFHEVSLSSFLLHLPIVCGPTLSLSARNPELGDPTGNTPFLRTLKISFLCVSSSRHHDLLDTRDSVCTWFLFGLFLRFPSLLG